MENASPGPPLEEAVPGLKLVGSPIAAIAAIVASSSSSSAAPAAATSPRCAAAGASPSPLTDAARTASLAPALAASLAVSLAQSCSHPAAVHRQAGSGETREASASGAKSQPPCPGRHRQAAKSSRPQNGCELASCPIGPSPPSPPSASAAASPMRAPQPARKESSWPRAFGCAPSVRCSPRFASSRKWSKTAEKASRDCTPWTVGSSCTSSPISSSE
mmetsp:Transcript_2654/g.8945  ORF Transcript_2654/g.8945 Transcript_2654/m.8945 type:complete len:218 (-) Transcript_2654:65-718(-)